MSLHVPSSSVMKTNSVLSHGQRRLSKRYSANNMIIYKGVKIDIIWIFQNFTHWYLQFKGRHSIREYMFPHAIKGNTAVHIYILLIRAKASTIHFQVMKYFFFCDSKLKNAYNNTCDLVNHQISSNFLFNRCIMFECKIRKDLCWRCCTIQNE